jgi:hypothetical protein
MHQWVTGEKQNRLRAWLRARAWARFRRRYGAAIARPPGRLRKALRAAWGLALGVLFMAAWAVALLLAIPVAALAAVLALIAWIVRRAAAPEAA